MHLTTNAAPAPDMSDCVNRATKHSGHPLVLETDGDRASAGSLTWGVKDTFLRYVSGLPDGVCEVTAEVLLPGKGRFEFPLTSTDGYPPTAFRFAGSVTFRGHRDFLFVSFVDLKLERVNGNWTLTCRHPENPAVRLNLATGTRTKVGVGCDHDHTHISATLTLEGAEMFGGNYPPGEPLSDLVLRLPKSPQPQHNTDNPE